VKSSEKASKGNILEVLISEYSERLEESMLILKEWITFG